MKKLLKVLGIIFAVIVVLLVGLFIVSKIKEHKALNTPLAPDNYYEGYAAVAGGPLEAKYPYPSEQIIQLVSLYLC